MPRPLSAAVQAALAAATVRPAFFYEGEFSTGTVRLWTGYGTYSWNGQSWLGAGEMLTIAPIEEVSDIRAAGFSVVMSGEASNIRSASLSGAEQGLAGSVWIGFLDSAIALLDEPELCFSGRLDRPEVVDDGQRATVSMNYESNLADLDRVRLRRWTHEDQQLAHPGDLGFQYVPTLQDAKIPWGSALINAATVSAFNASVRSGRA